MPDDTDRTEEPASANPPVEAAANEDDPYAALGAEKAALAAAVEELRDKYLRAVAEAENIRKRAEREIAEVRTYGIALFARDVLGVADNLARVLEAISPDERVVATGTLKALLDGVQLTQRELQKVLEKHGIHEIDPLGEKFDPHFHQAMFEVPTAQVPAGMVVKVVQAGYAIGERVLRPALVAVSKSTSQEMSGGDIVETPGSNVEGAA